ncbi:MAG: patatin-like phospholipase family protein [Actinomycetota bacterium]
MTTAFVLSGGGNLGAVQVGMLRALYERGVEPDILFGTSVGALNAAFLAGRPGEIDELDDVWRRVRRSDVFPSRPLGGMLGLFGRRSHLVSPDGLRRLVRSNLTYRHLEDAALPITVVATFVNDGSEVLISSGDAVDAVAASAAIPGVFPSVRIDGRDLMDGGVANNTPISCAIEAGASTVYVLPTGFACALDNPPRSALAMALHSVTLLIQQRLMSDVARYQDSFDLRVIPPLCPINVSPVDFGHTGDLVSRSFEATTAWLSRRGRRPADQSQHLAFHAHS